MSGFVRLVDRLSASVYADLDTGWSIAGRDVRRIPDEGPQADVVNKGIQNGILETASQAEWDEVHDESYAKDFAGSRLDVDDSTGAVTVRSGQPHEGALRAAAAEHGAALDDRRNAGPSDAEALHERDRRIAELESQLAQVRGDGDSGQLVDYEDASYKDLQQEAKRRGLGGSGSREDLIERLHEHDAEQAGEDDGETPEA